MFALRRTALLRQPQRLTRFYSNDNYDGSPSGLSGQSDTASGFDKRERTNEDYYVKQHEREHLKALREEIQKREKELSEIKEKAEKLEH